MPPRDRVNQKLTWGWAFSTGDPALDVRLEDAAQAAWPYARVCAWTYLSDGDAAHDLMDHALQNAAHYASRHPSRPTDKLIARIKGVLRRRAKQLAAKKRRELSSGSLVDLRQNPKSVPTGTGVIWQLRPSGGITRRSQHAEEASLRRGDYFRAEAV